MDPITVNSILLLPALLIFFGVFVYGVAFGNGMRLGALPRYRWVGVALVAIATLVGARFVFLMRDAFYRAMLQGRKVELAHYVAFLIPLVLLLSVFGSEYYFKRSQLDLR